MFIWDAVAVFALEGFDGLYRIAKEKETLKNVLVNFQKKNNLVCLF